MRTSWPDAPAAGLAMAKPKSEGWDDCATVRVSLQLPEGYALGRAPRGGGTAQEQGGDELSIAHPTPRGEAELRHASSGCMYISAVRWQSRASGSPSNAWTDVQVIVGRGVSRSVGISSGSIRSDEARELVWSYTPSSPALDDLVSIHLPSELATRGVVVYVRARLSNLAGEIVSLPSVPMLAAADLLHLPPQVSSTH